LLVIECDGPVGAERIARAVGRLLDVCPWPAARLRRPLPWGKLQWVARAGPTRRGPQVRRAALATREDLDRALAAELNAAIEPRREAPLRISTFDVAQDPARTAGVLVLSWYHPLLDARGGQNLLAHLSRADGGLSWDGASDPWADAKRRSLRERSRIAGRSLRYLRTVSPEPPVSLAATVIPPGRVCFLRESFVASEVGDQRARRGWPWRRAVAQPGTPGLALPGARVRGPAAKGDGGAHVRQPARVLLRALPAVRHRGSARPRARTAPSDGRGSPRRLHRGERRGHGVPRVPAALD